MLLPRETGGLTLNGRWRRCFCQTPRFTCAVKPERKERSLCLIVTFVYSRYHVLRTKRDARACRTKSANVKCPELPQMVGAVSAGASSKACQRRTRRLLAPRPTDQSQVLG